MATAQTQQQDNTKSVSVVDKAQKYISIDDILDLHDKGLSHAKIAQKLGCSKVNVFKRLKRHREQVAYAREYTNHRLEMIRSVQYRLLASMTDDAIKKMPPSTRITAYGILFDKERLLLNKSTSNVSVLANIVKDLTEEDKAELEQAKTSLIDHALKQDKD